MTRDNDDPLQAMIGVATAAGTTMGYQTVAKAIREGATLEQLEEFCDHAVEEAIPRTMGPLPTGFAKAIDEASTSQARAIVTNNAIGGGAVVREVNFGEAYADDKKDEDLW